MSRDHASIPPKILATRSNPLCTRFLRWDSVVPTSGTGTLHDVRRGLVNGLPVADGPANTCFQPGLAGDFVTDIEIPPLGNSSYHLTGARNVCGASGFGQTSGGQDRSHTGWVEVCDGVDNDCDGVLPPDELDVDLDGVPVCGGDCDDAEPARFPGNPEICDRLDNDCDGMVPPASDVRAQERVPELPGFVREPRFPDLEPSARNVA